MISTGASLIILAAFLLTAGREVNYANTVFEVFGANIVINLGLFFLFKLEFRNIILEYLLDVSYIIAVLVIFGKVFEWYAVPIWFLIVMAVVIYIFVSILAIVNLRKNSQKLNTLLKNHRRNK
jgi:hypothetical protein